MWCAISSPWSSGKAPSEAEASFPCPGDRQNSDGGALFNVLASRDTVTTAGGAVASANFDLAAGQDWLGHTYVINGA